MIAALVIASMASASVAIGAHYTAPELRKLIYVFKPLTTLLLLVLAMWGSRGTALYGGAIALGLGLSLLGDVFLMLPQDRFVHGLLSFFAAHACYCVAFASATPQWVAWWPFALIAAAGTASAWSLWPGVPRAMHAPVLAYISIISVMAALAIHRWVALPGDGALSAAAGSVLFLLSDGLLAWDRFRGRFHLARAAVLATYWLGQGLIAASTAG
jgi:uncharacterized membrane protein YhhN